MTVPYKQIVITMGEGAKAALSAFDYLIRSTPVVVKGGGLSKARSQSIPERHQNLGVAHRARRGASPC